MPTTADLRRRARVALILRATGPWSRRPHPGQRYKHGWIPAGPTATIAAKWHRRLAGLARLVAAVDSGEVAHGTISGGLHGQTEWVAHRNGTRTIHKVTMDAAQTMGPGFDARRQADAEQLAGLLGQRMKVTVPRVLRFDEDEIYMDEVPGTRADRVANARGKTVDEVAARHMGTTAAARLATFDILTGSWDRGNETNWNVDQDGVVWGYDHALSFWDGRGDAADAPDLAGPFATFWFLTYDPTKVRWGWGGFDWKDNPLTPADIEFLRARLAEVESDFDALGRHDWWEFASMRLETIAQHATGTQGVFT